MPGVRDHRPLPESVDCRTPCARSKLGLWLAETGGSFHSSLVFGQLHGRMGTCVHTDGLIGKGEVLTSCSIKAALTRQNCLDRIEKLFQQCSECSALGQLAQGDQLEGAQGHHAPYKPVSGVWLDRQAISFYLMLTKLSCHIEASGSDQSPICDLKIRCAIGAIFSFHQEYVRSLPVPEDLMTPLYWTEAEFEKLRFTDLFQSAIERKKSWTMEYREMMTSIHETAPALHDYLSRNLSCADYLWANTMVTSRAFPSSLLGSPAPINTHAESKLPGRHDARNHDPDACLHSEPILLPGVDALNHKRGSKVQWKPLTIDLDISRVEVITLEDSIQPGEQVFNNYGAKSTAELILGYGFALDAPDWKSRDPDKVIIENPDDFFTIKLAAPQLALVYSPIIMAIFGRFDTKDLFHHVQRNCPIPPLLLSQLKVLVVSSPEEEELINNSLSDLMPLETSSDMFRDEFVRAMPEKLTWENELNSLDCLRSMLELKLEDLNQINHTSDEESEWAGVREPIRKMIRTYRQGQHNILVDALKRLEQAFNATIKQAEADGFKFTSDEEG